MNSFVDFISEVLGPNAPNTTIASALVHHGYTNAIDMLMINDKKVFTDIGINEAYSSKLMKAITKKRKEILDEESKSHQLLQSRSYKKKEPSLLSRIFCCTRKKVFTNTYRESIDVKQEEIPRVINQKLPNSSRQKPARAIQMLDGDEEKEEYHPPPPPEKAIEEVKLPPPIPVSKFRFEPNFKIARKKGSLEIRELIFDEKNKRFDPQKAKTIILIGETGSGKTTLINAMCNFLLNVQFKDPFRYQLIIEEGLSQAHSQTSKVTSYSILDYFYGYQVRLVDTPGFGDTKGIQVDKQNKQKIFDLLKTEERIDAVCFVCKASQTRITPTQRYVMEEVLTLFGKDAAKNIFLMLTFADAGEPLVVKALQENNFPFETSYSFNNSALFVDPEKCTSLTEQFWKIGEISLDNFFKELLPIAPFSLNLTKEVIKEREQMSSVIKGLMPKISNGLAMMEHLRQIQNQIERHYGEINDTKCFTFEQTITKSRTVPCPPGIATTYCPTCHHTCHDSCCYFQKEDKVNCSSMENGNCTVCPKKCPAAIHFHEPHIIEYYNDTETVVMLDKKSKYERAESNLTFAEQILQEVKQKLKEITEDCMNSIKTANKCINRLNEIALKKGNMSMKDYIELQIENEKSQMNPGYQNRIKSLQELLREVVVANRLMENEPINNIFDLDKLQNFEAK